MSKTYNLVGGGNVEKAVLAVTVTNGTPTSVTATKTGGSVSLVHDSTNGIWTGNVTPGTWTVTATDGTNSGSISVTVDDVKVYSRIVGMSELGGDYTKLEWIELTGSLNTQTYPISAKRMVSVLQWAYGLPSGIVSFCLPNNWGGDAFIGLLLNGDADAFQYYVGNSSTHGSFWPLSIIGSGKHTYNLRYGTLIFDSTTYSNSYVNKTSNTNAPIFLSGTSTKALRVFSYLLKNTADTANESYMLPAKRNSDSVVGMYDTVRNLFITASSGSTTAGPAA